MLTLVLALKRAAQDSIEVVSVRQLPKQSEAELGHGCRHDLASSIGVNEHFPQK